MMRDHLDMARAWGKTVRAIQNPPEGLDICILHIAERCIRLRAFTTIPAGPENALALVVLVDEFSLLRADKITEGERRQADHALTLSAIALERARGMACLLYTSPSPRDQRGSRMPSSA